MFFRVTYDDVGIYEALKRLIWDNNSNFSKKDWEDFKASCDVNWLNVPKVYGDNNYSYFTEKGFDMFLQRTYPLIIKWLDKDKIKFNTYSFDLDEITLVYFDEYQIVIKEYINI